METHRKHLQSICRICGKDCSDAPSKNKPKPKAEFSGEIQEIYGVNVFKDDPDIFGQIICRPCIRNMNRYQTKKSEGGTFKTYIKMTDVFRQHTEKNCDICQREMLTKDSTKVPKRKGEESHS